MAGEREVDVGQAALARRSPPRRRRAAARWRRAPGPARSASIMRVPIGCTSISAVIEFGGTCAWAFDHVSWVELMTSSSSGMRSSADRRVDAVRQNASSVRLSRRSCSAVNLVGRVKSTARMRRRRCCGRRRLLGQPALAGRVDQRRDRVGAEDLAAHAATASCALPAQQLRRPCRPPRAPSPRPSPRRRASCGRDAAGGGGDDRDAHPSRAARARRPRCAGRRRGWPRERRTCCAPPTSTASRRTRGAPSPRARRSSAGTARSANLRGVSGAAPATAGSTMWASPAMPARRSISASPMHEPSPSETSTSPGAPRPRARPSAPWSPPGHQLSPSRERSSSTPPWSGTSRKEIEQSSPSTTRSESSSSAMSSRDARPASTRRHDRAEHVGGGRGRRGLQLHAGHRAERVDVGRADDVADLAEGGEGDTRRRAPRRAGRTCASASLGETSSRTVASMSPTMPSTMPSSRCSASPMASTASASGSAERARHGDVDGRARASPRARCRRCPSRCWRARAERRAGVRCTGSRDVVLSQAATRAGGGGASTRVAVDDQGDLAVGHDGAARQGGVLGDLGRERPGDQLALAEELGDGDGEAPVAPRTIDGVLGVRRRRAAEALGARRRSAARRRA